MAAPTYVTRPNVTQITATTGSISIGAGTGAAGDVAILQVMQDGTGADAAITSISGSGTIENLAGTDGAMTDLAISQQVGNPAAAKQHLWIGRLVDTLGVTFNLSTPGDDLYVAVYLFRTVNTGTSLSDVIENSTPGSAPNHAGTGITVDDEPVTTLGADRLACNFVGINDDATGLAAFAGESGGNWVLPVSIFESSTGTDGTCALMTADMVSAGTITNGSATITSDGWGVVGFALIGTTAAGPATSFIWNPAPSPAARL